jgi:hypothetical protein
VAGIATTETGLTWGAASPAAVVGIARDCGSIAQNVVSLVAEADTVEKMIQADFDGVNKILSKAKSGEDADEIGKARKAWNNVKAFGIEAVAGITGLDPPSVRVCEAHIELYRARMSDLVEESHKLGPKVLELVKFNGDMEAFFDEMPDGPEKKALEPLLQPAFDALNALLETVVGLNEDTIRGAKKLKEWGEELDALRKLVGGWVDNVGFVFGAATDLGLSVGATGAALDATMAMLESVARSISDFVIERGR